MNSEQMRIEIAELMGWNIDPLDDLNACCLMEKSLTDAEYRLFHYWLVKLHNDKCMPICRCHSAEAIKRCEAFLRAKGTRAKTPNAE